MKLQKTEMYVKEFHKNTSFSKNSNGYLHHICSPYDYMPS